MSALTVNSPLVVSLGGHSLGGAESSFGEEDLLRAEEFLSGFLPLIRQGQKMVLIFGNGPQVGRLVHQQILSLKEYQRPSPLNVCVADTQGRIGSLLQLGLMNLCRKNSFTRQICTLITHVRVDSQDKAFHSPSKPIGQFITREEAQEFTGLYHHVFKEQIKDPLKREQNGKTWRRVVASPRPLEILESSLIEDLLKGPGSPFLICSGGGGIPVELKADGEYRGVEAVIDKDFTTALLATHLNAKWCVFLTDVEAVYLDFSSPARIPLETVSAEQMGVFLKEGYFAEGSMGPKVQAALQFLSQGGERVIIAHYKNLELALEGKSGTTITKNLAK